MTPYAEQAEQARNYADEIQQLGRTFSYRECVVTQKRLAQALDTLARVEAVIEQRKTVLDQGGQEQDICQGWNLCCNAVLKALEGGYE